MGLPVSYKALFEQLETIENISPSCSAVIKEALTKGNTSLVFFILMLPVRSRHILSPFCMMLFFSHQYPAVMTGTGCIFCILFLSLIQTFLGRAIYLNKKYVHPAKALRYLSSSEEENKR